MPAFTVLNGGSSQRRARLIALAVFLTLVLLFLGHSRVSTNAGPGWDSTGVQRPPAAEKISHGDAPPSHTEQYHQTRPIGDDGEPIQAPDQDDDSYHNQDDQLAAAIPTATPPAADPATLPTGPSSPTSTVVCERYESLLSSRPGPKSAGKHGFPYVRPRPECRTFHLPELESLIDEMRDIIKDPDLFRLFENSYPITLDTMVKWRGYAIDNYDPETRNGTRTDQELAYVITGDIDAMWLRDSASQIYSYLPLLKPSTHPDSLASLWRGLINSHARYITISPYCHSFQPPPESGIRPTANGAYSQNNPNPPYDPSKVFDCKWELDSLASFLQISVGYYRKTGDIAFFGKYNWVAAVRAAVDAAGAMRLGTYAEDGKVEASAWTFTGWTNRGSETLTNDGLGNPSRENGMVRTAFRPSDDACIFQFLVPANMMWAKYLEDASEIMERLGGGEEARNLTAAMRDFAFGIRKGIEKDGIVRHREFGDMFAYEVDGFGSANMMDDANVPSLLALPLWNFTTSAYRLPDPPPGEKKRDYGEIYRNTRRFVLSDANPYFMKGPAISAVGGPHVGPGKAWPMAAVVAALTAYEGVAGVEDAEAAVEEQVRMVLNSTSGSGVLHESVNSWNEKDWTRAWFGWANGLFGELVIRMREEDERRGGKTGLLSKSWQ